MAAPTAARMDVHGFKKGAIFHGSSGSSAGEGAWACSRALEAMETQMVACIEESLSLCLYENARWLAERLVAAVPSEANVHLLAVCFFHCNQAYRAYHLLRTSGGGGAGSQYLLAQCCVQLGRWPEARDVLLRHGQQQVPQGAAGLYLLARVLRVLGQAPEARRLLLEALQLNPLLWCAYEELCALGADEEAGEVCATAARSEALLPLLLDLDAREQAPGRARAAGVPQHSTHSGEPAGPTELDPGGARPDAQTPGGASAKGSRVKGSGSDAGAGVAAGRGSSMRGPGAALWPAPDTAGRRAAPQAVKAPASRSPSPPCPSPSPTALLGRLGHVNRGAAATRGGESAAAGWQDCWARNEEEEEGGQGTPRAVHQLAGHEELTSTRQLGQGPRVCRPSPEQDALGGPPPARRRAQQQQPWRPWEEPKEANGDPMSWSAQDDEDGGGGVSGVGSEGGAAGGGGPSRGPGVGTAGKCGQGTGTAVATGPQSHGGDAAAASDGFVTPAFGTLPRPRGPQGCDATGHARQDQHHHHLQGGQSAGGDGAGGAPRWDFSGVGRVEGSNWGPPTGLRAGAEAPGASGAWSLRAPPPGGPRHGAWLPQQAGPPAPLRWWAGGVARPGAAMEGLSPFYASTSSSGDVTPADMGGGGALAFGAATAGTRPAGEQAAGGTAGVGRGRVAAQLSPLRLLGLLGGDRPHGALDTLDGGGSGVAALNFTTPLGDTAAVAPPPPPPRKPPAATAGVAAPGGVGGPAEQHTLAFPGGAFPGFRSGCVGAGANAATDAHGSLPPTAATPLFRSTAAAAPSVAAPAVSGPAVLAGRLPSPSLGPAAAAAVVRLAMEDGKVRKVSGRALFTGTEHAQHASPGSRRSSRLAALAGSGGAAAARGGVASTPSSPAGGAAAAAQLRMLGGGGRPGPAGPDAAAQQPQRWQPVAPQGVNTPGATPAAVGHGPVPGRLQRGRDEQQSLQQQWQAWAAGRAGGGAGAAANAAAAAMLVHPVTLAPSSTTSAGSSAALGMASALSMLRHAYDAVRCTAQYRGPQALAALQQLPPCQRSTAWAQLQVGRVLLDHMDYLQAAEAFEAAHQLDRYCVEGLELYSTVLWHLRRDSELSFLAQHALSTDRLAPQSWCVVGNLMSLHKDPQAALKLFERALQLNPHFTYAYTLSGHEYAASEEPEQAVQCYRNALRTNPRHYNAMYGMGCVFFRQEQYELALVQFRSAASIAPGSSVLQCYLGMTLQRQGCREQALAKLQAAIQLDPRNPLARYEKASALAAHGDHEAALDEYRALVHIAPGEPSVYLQMGKLLKRLGQLPAAQRQMELALSFSASSADAATIKAAIERLTISDEQEDEGLL